MMLPGMTIWPPNFLTPSRRPALSRPLREEPPAFLCAICCSYLALRAVRASDVGDAQYGLLLAVPFLASIIVPPLLLEDDDLGRPRLLDHGGTNRSAIKKRGAGRDLCAFADHQHLAELDRGAWLRCQSFDRDDVVLDDFVLLAAGPDDCEHDIRRYSLPHPGHNRHGAHAHTRPGAAVGEPRNIGSRLALSTNFRRGFDGIRRAL